METDKEVQKQMEDARKRGAIAAFVLTLIGYSILVYYTPNAAYLFATFVVASVIVLSTLWFVKDVSRALLCFLSPKKEAEIRAWFDDNIHFNALLWIEKIKNKVKSVRQRAD